MIHLILVGIVGAGLGFGFRGLIARDKTKIGADIKADVAKVEADVKAKL
jgi:hypothetical protein